MTDPFGSALENLDNMGQTPSQTDRARKPASDAPVSGGRDADRDKPTSAPLGQADGLDPDKVGDIADEGTGRRG